MEIHEVLAKIGKEKADLKNEIGRIEYLMNEAREKALDVEKQARRLEDEFQKLHTVIEQLEEEKEATEEVLKNMEEFENSIQFWTKNL